MAAVQAAAPYAGAARVSGSRRPSADGGRPNPSVWYVHPTAEEAWHAYRHVGHWVAAALAAGARRAVFDLRRARGLDFTSFGVALQRLRAAGIDVTITNAEPHIAASLREIGLLHGATLHECRRRPDSGGTRPWSRTRVPGRSAVGAGLRLGRAGEEHTLAA